MAAKLPRGVAASKSLYYKYTGRCRKSGIEFALTFEKFINITGKDCAYCGTPPKQVHVKNRTCNGPYIYNGIDRVNPNKGYISSNCTPCCKVCNFMKKNMTQKKFIAHLRAILLYFSHD